MNNGGGRHTRILTQETTACAIIPEESVFGHLLFIILELPFPENEFCKRTNIIR